MTADFIQAEGGHLKLSKRRPTDAITRLKVSVKLESIEISLTRQEAVSLAAMLLAFAPLQTCRVCGCDDLHACEGGCSWASD